MGKNIVLILVLLLIGGVGIADELHGGISGQIAITLKEEQHLATNHTGVVNELEFFPVANFGGSLGNEVAFYLDLQSYALMSSFLAFSLVLPGVEIGGQMVLPVSNELNFLLQCGPYFRSIIVYSDAGIALNTGLEFMVVKDVFVQAKINTKLRIWQAIAFEAPEPDVYYEQYPGRFYYQKDDYVFGIAPSIAVSLHL